MEEVEKIPVWLDCDPGHDDAFAILFAAFHPSLQLLGISTVHGNASLDKTTKNALSVLEAIGRQDIRVYPGSRKPFCRESHSAPDIHGESGLDGTNLLPIPSRKPLTKCNAASEMYEALAACPKGTPWLIATGALTNVALLFATFPSLASHIRGLSIMGGAVGEGFTNVPVGPAFKDTAGKTRTRIGNHTPYAEFNIWCDPESAQSIFSNLSLRPKTALITLDLTHQAFADKDVQELILHGADTKWSKPTRLRQMFYDLLTFFAHTYAEVFHLSEGPPLHDPLACAVLLADVADEYTKINFDDRNGERWEIDVELAGDEMGRTRILPARDGVSIPRGLDLMKFWAVLNDCLDRADNTGSVEW